MRYKYSIKKDTGETELIEDMSWKKMLKRLLVKYPKFTGRVSYTNKKGHELRRFINNGKAVWKKIKKENNGTDDPVFRPNSTNKTMMIFLKNKLEWSGPKPASSAETIPRRKIKWPLSLF